MQNRREFLKTSLIVAGSAIAAQSANALASSHEDEHEGHASAYPDNIIYTADKPGVWAKKDGSHAPQVSKEGNKVEIFTKHGMSEEHFIVRHTLVGQDGQVIGAKTFKPADEEARSEYELPEGYSGKLYATSFCNKHDFWMSEFAV